MSLRPGKIAATYAFASAIWILLSDRLAGWLFSGSAEALTLASTIKGWAYVGLMSVMLLSLLRRYQRQILGQQAELKAGKAYLQSIVDTVNDAIFIHAWPSGQIMDVNKRACEMYGYDRETLLRLPVEALSAGIAPYDQQHAMALMETGFRVGFLTAEWQAMAKDGHVFWVEVSICKAFVRESDCLVVSCRDIADRKSAEEKLLLNRLALSEAVSWKNTIFNVPAVGILVVTGQRVMTEVSAGLAALLGYRPEELIGHGVALIHLDQDHSDEFGTRYWSSTAEERVVSVEWPLRCKDGTPTWCHVSGSAISPGEPLKGVVWIIQDISERKSVEQALRESERRYKALHNSSFGGIVLHDKGIILDCNQGLSSITGYEYEELIGMDGLLLVAEGSRSLVLGNILSGYEKPYEAFGRRKNGEEFPMRLEARNIPYHGKMIRAVEFRDITETKQADEALREEALRRQILMEKSYDGIAVINQEHCVVETNERFASMLGYTREEVLGLKTWEYEAVMSEEDIWQGFPELDKINMVFETSHRRKDGSIFDVEVSASGALVGGQALLFTICRDISARKRAEKELTWAKDQAEAANLAKSQFLANMSHEIRTPLNGVLGMLQLIRTSEVSGEVECYAEMATRAGHRLTSLLGDILDLSRIEAGRMPLSKKPFNISDIVAALNETFHPMNYSRGVSFVPVVSPGVPQGLVGDEVRVRQILFNIVGNAMKFADNGDVRLEISLLQPDPLGRVRLLFCISDDGVGIPDDKVDQICHPFTQVSEDYSKSFQGAGLGLSIVQHLVRAMEGTLVFESEAGQGTTVYLMLPFEVAATNKLELKQAPPPGAGRDLEGLRILLVEDEEISRLSAKVTLEKMGHHVVTADNGEEALEALRGSTYDCVLMDVQMEVMDGVEATRRIRSGDSGLIDKDVHIIAMTAYAMAGDRDKFLAFGMDDYVAKPASVEEISRALRRLARKLLN